MASPGFSLTELIQAIAQCKTIYDTFTDEYENAPARIRELVDTVNYLRSALADLKSILEYHHDVYPQQQSFAHKLDECQRFIKDYRALSEGYLISVRETSFTDRLRRAWETAWQTTQYAFDDKRARDLKDALSLEIHKLVLFILFFVLKRTVPANLLSHGEQISPSNRASRPADEEIKFKLLYERLQAIQYSYKREMIAAVAQKRPPNSIGAYRELESVWHDLCDRAGLVLEDGTTPPLPRDRLLEAPAQHLNELVINLVEPSLHTKLISWPRRETPLPASLSISSPETSINSPIWSLAPSSNQNTQQTTPEIWREPFPKPLDFEQLPPPALPDYKAKITLHFRKENRVVRLHTWTTIRKSSGLTIIWTSENKTETLKHYLPVNAFPYTLHTLLSERGGNNFQVMFHEVGQLVLETEHGSHHHQDEVANYIFLQEDDMKRFQGDVRNRELVGRFDFESLWSKSVSGRKEVLEASLQNLNIWKDRGHPSHHTISYYASNFDEQHRHHVQHPITGFQSDLKKDSQEPKTIVLEFSGRRSSSTSIHTPVSRRWSIRKSFSNDVSQLSRSASSSAETSEAVSLEALSNMITYPKYIKVEFDKKEVANEFIQLFDERQKEDFQFIKSTPIPEQSSPTPIFATSLTTDPDPTCEEKPAFGFWSTPPLASSSGQPSPYERRRSSNISPTLVPVQDPSSFHSLPVSQLSSTSPRSTMSHGSPPENATPGDHGVRSSTSSSQPSFSPNTSPKLPELPFQVSPEPPFWSR